MPHVLMSLLRGPLRIRGGPSRADVAVAAAAAAAARAAVAADVHVVSAQALADKAAALVADTQRTSDASVLRAASQAAAEAAAELASATALAEEVHQSAAAYARAHAMGAQFRTGVATQVAASSAWWLLLVLASRAVLSGMGRMGNAGIVDTREAARMATAATTQVDRRVQRLARDVLGATRQAGAAGGGRAEQSSAGKAKAKATQQGAPERRKAAQPAAPPQPGPLSGWRAAVEASREVPLGAGVSWSK